MSRPSSLGFWEVEISVLGIEVEENNHYYNLGCAESQEKNIFSACTQLNCWNGTHQHKRVAPSTHPMAIYVSYVNLGVSELGLEGPSCSPDLLETSEYDSGLLSCFSNLLVVKRCC